MRANIKVVGIHREGNGEHRVETAVTGEWIERGGAIFLLYEETDPESGLSSSVRIKYRPGSIEVDRKGDIETGMIFESGRTRGCTYITPQGRMDLQIRCIAMSESRKGNTLDLTADYYLLLPPFEEDKPLPEATQIRIMAELI